MSENRIEGRNAVIEAFRSGKTIDRLFMLDGSREGAMQTVRKEAAKHGTPIKYVNRQRLDQMSETGRHQGVIAEIAAYSYGEIEDLFEKAKEKGEDPFFILLDGIEDPHNLGAIIRTANLAGADILIHVSCGASDDASVSGLLAYAPTYNSPNLENRLVSASQHLADCLLDTLSMQTGMNNLGILDGDRVTGINWAELPVTTIQIGFLTNAEDELFVGGGSGQSRIVTGLANGIDSYFAGQDDGGE